MYAIRSYYGLERVEDLPPHYPAVQTFKPRIGAGFAQMEGEWSDVILRAGLRLDYFNPSAELPNDLSNPANAIAGAPTSSLEPSTRKVSVSPRLALSYPVTRDAVV